VSKGLLRPVVSLPRTFYGVLAAVLSAACRVLVACVPFSFNSTSSSSSSAPSIPVTASLLGGKHELKIGLGSKLPSISNETKDDETKNDSSGHAEGEETAMRNDTSKAVDRQQWTSDMHTDGEGNYERNSNSNGYWGRGTGRDRDRDGPRIQDFFAFPSFPQELSSFTPTGAPSNSTTSFRPKEGVRHPLQLVPPGQCSSLSTSLMALHPSETPSPSTVGVSRSDSTPFPFLLSASSFSTFSSSDAHPSTASFACLTPNSGVLSSILPLRSKIPHSVRASLLPFGPSPTYFLASDVPTVTARPVPPNTSSCFPDALHMTDANLSPVKLNGHSNLWGEPGTSDSDCDSRGNLLEYSDSDSESDTEGERGREKDIEMEREIEREGDQGYLTASDGEEGEGDDEQKWTNGSEESRKPTESDRNGMESLSTSEGLSRLGPKRDGRIDQSPQRTRTVRTVMMKRIIKSPSVKGRNSTDREEDKDKDRPYIHIPRTAPSSSTPHTPTRVPQSLGYEGKSPPSVFLRTEISTDMRSVHSVRTPLRTSRYSRGSGVGVSVGVGADRGERGKSAEGDDMRGRREGKVKKDTYREYGMDTARNGTIFETERESRRDLSASERKGGGVHRAEGRIADRGERTDGPSPDTPKGKGSMWHTSGQKHSVKVIPTGQSEIPLPCLLHVFFVVS
jgi:hypothetical protein